MIVASSEKDGSSLIADEALGDASLAEVLRGGPAFLQNHFRGQDLGDESVAVGSRLQLIHFDEHWLPLLQFLRVLRLLGLVNLLLLLTGCCH